MSIISLRLAYMKVGLLPTLYNVQIMWTIIKCNRCFVGLCAPPCPVVSFGIADDQCEQ